MSPILCIYVCYSHCVDYQVYGWLKALPGLRVSGDLFETDSEYARLKNVLIGEHVCAHACSCAQCGYVLGCVGFYVCLYDVIKNCLFVISLFVNLLSVIYCYYLSLNSKNLSTCWSVHYGLLVHALSFAS